MKVRYTRDGVPIFDEASESLVGYQGAMLIYAGTIEWKNGKVLVRPKLHAVLEGSAKRLYRRGLNN